jgi:hypothetical protein
MNNRLWSQLNAVCFFYLKCCSYDTNPVMRGADSSRELMSTSAEWNRTSFRFSPWVLHNSKVWRTMWPSNPQSNGTMIPLTDPGRIVRHVLEMQAIHKHYNHFEDWYCSTRTDLLPFLLRIRYRRCAETYIPKENLKWFHGCVRYFHFVLQPIYFVKIYHFIKWEN